MQKLTSMWKNTSKNGTIYYSGKLGNAGIIAFENLKENEKQPDLIIYVKDEIKQAPKEEKIEDTTYDPFEDFGEQIEIDDNFLDQGVK